MYLRGPIISNYLNATMNQLKNSIDQNGATVGACLTTYTGQTKLHSNGLSQYKLLPSAQILCMSSIPNALEYHCDAVSWSVLSHDGLRLTMTS